MCTLHFKDCIINVIYTINHPVFYHWSRQAEARHLSKSIVISLLPRKGDSVIGGLAIFRRSDEEGRHRA